MITLFKEVLWCLRHYDFSVIWMTIGFMGILLTLQVLTLCMLGNFSCYCCRLLTFFKNELFQKNLSGTLFQCQTVWIQFRTDIMSVLIWVQTVCKDYQQTTKVAVSKKTVIMTAADTNWCVGNLMWIVCLHDLSSHIRSSKIWNCRLP